MFQKEISSDKKSRNGSNMETKSEASVVSTPGIAYKHFGQLQSLGLFGRLS
jgi:hypothetical protein